MNDAFEIVSAHSRNVTQTAIIGEHQSPEWLMPFNCSLAEPFCVLAEMQRAGLIKRLRVSNVTAEQIAEAQSIAPVVRPKLLQHRQPSG
jgi:aryl-alcohol dehydrogenase-like predicted oxidoreductase